MVSISLPLIILISILGPFFCWFINFKNFKINNNVKVEKISFQYSLLLLVVVILSFLSYCSSTEISGFKLVYQKNWIQDLGIDFNFGVDAFSMLSILLSAIVFPIIIYFSSRKEPSFYAFLFLIFTGLIGALSSLNLLVFYCFFELMLFPLYYLILSKANCEARQAGIKFILYTLGSSLVMLVGILYCGYAVYQSTGEVSFNIDSIAKMNFSSAEQQYLFLAFFVAFAVKAPIFPFHTWLPNTYSKSDSTIATLLAGLLFQLGIYGVYRFCFYLFPEASSSYQFLLALLGTLGIVVAGMIAYIQKEVKLVLAYASVSHIGFSILGLSTFTVFGTIGGLFQVFTHILIATGLFILGGILVDRTKKTSIDSFGGLARQAPVFSFFFLIFSLTSISVPLSASFVGEFMLLAESFKVQAGITSFATLGVIIGACYTLRLCQKLLFGEKAKGENGYSKFKDLSLKEAFVLSPILVLIIFLGIYPKPIIKTLETGSKNKVFQVDLNPQLPKFKNKILEKELKKDGLKIA